MIITKKNRLAILIALLLMTALVIVPGVQAQTPPALLTCEVTNDGDYSLTFDQAIASSAGTEGQFTVTVDGAAVNVTAVENTDTEGEIKLILETKALTEQAIVVEYVKSDNPDLQIKSVDGEAIESFTYGIADTPELLAPPAITPDSTNNQVGQAIELSFASTPDWSEKITDIKVDDVSIRDQSTISDGLISINAEVFTSPQDYVIEVKATGYEDVTLTQSMAAQAVEEPEPVTPTVKLQDIDGHWAQANIEALVALGAISGNPDGTFLPEKNITRAEFASVLVNAYKLEPSQAKVFADTENHWAQAAIATAYASNIIAGYSDTQFGPEDTITREQMAVMVVKAANLATGNGETSFTDNSDISDWAAAFVAVAVDNKLMSGYPDLSFGPTKGASRAEAVTVIVNALL